MSQFLNTENAVVFIDGPLSEITHNNANTDFSYYMSDYAINAYVYDGNGNVVFNDTFDNIGNIGATVSIDLNNSSFRVVFPYALLSSYSEGVWMLKLNTSALGINHALNSVATFQWGAGYQAIYQNALDAKTNAASANANAILAKTSADTAAANASTAAGNASVAASNAYTAANNADAAKTAATGAKDAALKAVDLGGGDCTFNPTTGVVTFTSGSFRLKNSLGPVTSPQDATGRDSSTY